ncbi:hypothetical protein MEO_04140 [Candida albicans P94015]|nr:hypothetical protein MEO_04140 [Candida albicans P94015]
MIYTAEQIRHKKKLKKGINFNLLVVGVNDLGKKTFINTLINQPYYQINQPIPNTSHSSIAGTSNSEFSENSSNNNEFSIETNSFECCPRSIPIKLKISVTNNFGFNVHNDSHGDTLLSFIENKHRAILHEELKISRNPNLQDNRLHLGLYFINANVKGLSKFDISMMTKICHRINLLPIIAKRDGLTDIELIQCKHAINRDISENKIQIFNFLSKSNDDAGADADADHHYKRDGDIEEYMTLSAKEYNYLSELNKSIPFAIIGSNSIVGDPQNEIVRNTKWGSIQIEDKNICDFKILKNIIFETHLQEFKDVTVEKIYEKFRVEQLIKN